MEIEEEAILLIQELKQPVTQIFWWSLRLAFEEAMKKTYISFFAMKANTKFKLSKR